MATKILRLYDREDVSVIVNQKLWLTMDEHRIHIAAFDVITPKITPKTLDEFNEAHQGISSVILRTIQSPSTVVAVLPADDFRKAVKRAMVFNKELCFLGTTQERGFILSAWNDEVGSTRTEFPAQQTAEWYLNTSYLADAVTHCMAGKKKPRELILSIKDIVGISRAAFMLSDERQTRWAIVMPRRP